MCLMQGAWFANGVPVPSGESGPRDSMHLRKPTRPWRFYRLVSVIFGCIVEIVLRLVVCYRIGARSGSISSTVLSRCTSSLGWRICLTKVRRIALACIRRLHPRLQRQFAFIVEIAQISDIATSTCASPPNIAMPEAHAPPSPFGTTTTSPLSFSIMISQGSSLADHVSENAARFADWVDGLNMLRNSQIQTRDTEMFVQALTEIGLKIKLLGKCDCFQRLSFVWLGS